MNKHYRKALLEATIENLKSEYSFEDVNRETLEQLLDKDYDLSERIGENHWGEDFEEDIECLTEMYFEEAGKETSQEEDEKSLEEEMEEKLQELHIGFNFIPGIGFGYCKDEEDLAKMREFVRGGMVVSEMMKAFFEL